MNLDLYAGAGGWDEAARQLGLTTVGLELWHDACVTAVRAGHPRIRCDIATYPTAPFAGRVQGLIASPPCQAWSMAGKRQGEQDKARVHDLVNAYAAGSNDPGDGWADERSHHVAQPVRWIRDLRPEWVCLEQVPPVLDLWVHIGDVLRGWGYSVWTGVLNAADYGVPQTRRRAILIASRVRPVHQPETTHEQDPPALALFGARRPWVSMAEALGWTGAALTHERGAGMVERHGERPDRHMDELAFTITGGSKGSGPRLRWEMVNGSQENATARSDDEPAPTVYCSRPGNLRWQLVNRRDSPKWVEEHGERRNRESDEPAPTITGEAHRWQLRNGTQDNACIRSADEPAGTLFFGQRLNNVSWVDGDESRRVTVTEAAILQSFPADYPWHGNKTSQFLQVGNAVPPGLAAAVLAVAAGVPATARLDLAA